MGNLEEIQEIDGWMREIFGIAATPYHPWDGWYVYLHERLILFGKCRAFNIPYRDAMGINTVNTNIAIRCHTYVYIYII